MNAVTPFAFEDHLFRAVDRLGEPWFIAGDVAKILGYRDANNLTRTLDDDEKGTHIVSTLGGSQDVTVISEPGLYRAIIQRRSVRTLAPEVRAFIARFQRWVFHEVLPSLRHTGRYAIGEADTVPTGARDLITEDHDRRLVSEMRMLCGPAAGYALWRKLRLPDALTEPADCADADHVGAFISLRLRAVAGRRVRARALYAAYVAWSVAADLEPVSESRFGKRVALLFPRAEIGGRRWYRDCALDEAPALA